MRSQLSKFKINRIVYGGPQLSHQNQILTANYKALTSNSNRSHQIQIAHSKFKSLTANYKSLSKLQIAHSKLQITQQITNRSQQIQIAHSKFKSWENFRTGPYFIMHAFLIINICSPLFFETMHIPKAYSQKY